MGGEAGEEVKGGLARARARVARGGDGGRDDLVGVDRSWWCFRESMKCSHGCSKPWNLWNVKT